MPIATRAMRRQVSEPKETTSEVKTRGRPRRAKKNEVMDNIRESSPEQETTQSKARRGRPKRTRKPAKKTTESHGSQGSRSQTARSRHVVISDSEMSENEPENKPENTIGIGVEVKNWLRYLEAPKTYEDIKSAEAIAESFSKMVNEKFVALNEKSEQTSADIAVEIPKGRQLRKRKAPESQDATASQPKEDKNFKKKTKDRAAKTKKKHDDDEPSLKSSQKGRKRKRQNKNAVVTDSEDEKQTQIKDISCKEDQNDKDSSKHGSHNEKNASTDNEIQIEKSVTIHKSQNEQHSATSIDNIKASTVVEEKRKSLERSSQTSEPVIEIEMQKEQIEKALSVIAKSSPDSNLSHMDANNKNKANEKGTGAGTTTTDKLQKSRRSSLERDENLNANLATAIASCSPILFETPQSQQKVKNSPIFDPGLNESAQPSVLSEETKDQVVTKTPTPAGDATFIKTPVLSHNSETENDSDSTKPILNRSYTIEKETTSSVSSENSVKPKDIIKPPPPPTSSDSEEFSSAVSSPGSGSDHEKVRKQSKNTACKSTIAKAPVDKNVTCSSTSSSSSSASSKVSSQQKIANNKMGPSSVKPKHGFVVPGIKNASSNRVEKIQSKISNLISDKGAPPPTATSSKEKGATVKTSSKPPYTSTLKGAGNSSNQDRTNNYSSVPKIKTYQPISVHKDKGGPILSNMGKKATSTTDVNNVKDSKTIATGSTVKDKVKAFNSASVKAKEKPTVILPNKMKPTVLSSTTVAKTVSSIQLNKDKTSPKKAPISSITAKLLSTMKDNIFGSSKSKMPPVHGRGDNSSVKDITSKKLKADEKNVCAEKDKGLQALNTTYNVNKKYHQISNLPVNETIEEETSGELCPTNNIKVDAQKENHDMTYVVGFSTPDVPPSKTDREKIMSSTFVVPPGSINLSHMEERDVSIRDESVMDYSNYDITRFEDLDEESTDYRNNKRIPRWAADRENNEKAIFNQLFVKEFQVPKYIFPHASTARPLYVPCDEDNA